MKDSKHSSAAEAKSTQPILKGHRRRLSGRLALFLAFVATGANAIASGLDAWTQRYSQSSGQLNGITFGGNSYAAVGSKPFLGMNHGLLVGSPDGTSWNGNLTSVPVTSVAFDGGQFVAVDGGAQAWISTDGMNWTLHDTGTDPGLNGVAYGNGKFVAVGLNGSILTSPDGVAWTTRSIGTADADLYTLNAIAYGGGTFVAVGSYPGASDQVVAMLASTDGITWSITSPVNRPGSLYGVAWKDGVFVAVGSSGNIFTSPDSSSWTQQTSNISTALRSIASASAWFVAVGDSGSILTSQNGATWVGRNSGTTQNLLGVCFGISSFMAVGANQIVIESCCLCSPSVQFQLVADSVIVTWPYPSTCWVLQLATSINGPWTDVSTTPVRVGDNNQVTISPRPPTGFFRLRE